MKGLSLDVLGILILTILSVSVGVGILYSINSDDQDVHPVESAVKSSEYPACAEFEKDEGIGKEEFRTVVYSRYLEVCDKSENNLTLEFRLDRSFIDKIGEEFSSSPEILYRENCENIPGFNGIIVETGQPEVISSIGEKIKIAGERPVRICKR